MTNATKTTQTLKNVLFFYTSVTKPEKQLNPEGKAPASEHPMEGYSYEVKALVSESRFKKLKKAFKGAKNFDKATEYDILECKEKLNIEVDEDQVLIKFAQTVCIGKKISREDGTSTRKESYAIPQMGIKGKVQDKNGLAINQDTDLGYGTKGHLQFRPVRNDFGLYLYPNALCITELVEYVGGGGGVDEDDFDFEELDETDVEAIEGAENNSEDDDQMLF